MALPGPTHPRLAVIRQDRGLPHLCTEDPRPTAPLEAAAHPKTRASGGEPRARPGEGGTARGLRPLGCSEWTGKAHPRLQAAVIFNAR